MRIVVPPRSLTTPRAGLVGSSEDDPPASERTLAHERGDRLPFVAARRFRFDYRFAFPQHEGALADGDRRFGRGCGGGPMLGCLAVVQGEHQTLVPQELTRVSIGALKRRQGCSNTFRIGLGARYLRAQICGARGRQAGGAQTGQRDQLVKLPDRATAHQRERATPRLLELSRHLTEPLVLSGHSMETKPHWFSQKSTRHTIAKANRRLQPRSRSQPWRAGQVAPCLPPRHDQL